MLLLTLHDSTFCSRVYQPRNRLVDRGEDIAVSQGLGGNLTKIQEFA